VERAWKGEQKSNSREFNLRIERKQIGEGKLKGCMQRGNGQGRKVVRIEKMDEGGKLKKVTSNAIVII
jgi:hypothetical protein